MTDIIAIIVKGGMVMIPLVACSMISLALTIERMLFWAEAQVERRVAANLSLVENGKFEGSALGLGRSHSSQPSRGFSPPAWRTAIPS